MMTRRHLLTVLPSLGSAQFLPAAGNLAPSRSYDDLNALKEVRRLSVDGYVNAVAWNGTGSRLAVLSNFGAVVTIWSTASWSVHNSFRRYGGAYSDNSLAYLPDGTLLTSAPVGRSPDAKYRTLAIFSLVQWNPETGQPLRYIPDLTTLRDGIASFIAPTDTFTVSADASLVAGVSKQDVVLYSTQDWSFKTRLATPPTPTHPDSATSIAIAPDGHRLAVGTLFGWVHMFTLPNGIREFSFQAYVSRVGYGCSALAFSPDGRFLAIGRSGVSVGETDDGWTRIWDMNDHALIWRLFGGGGAVRSIAWSDGGRILAVGDDRALQFWYTGTLPTRPRLMEKNQDDAFSVAFSSSRWFAAADSHEVVIYR